MKYVVGQQGEVRVIKIDAITHTTKPYMDKSPSGAWIISHSEKGHHHVVGGNCEVLERTSNVPAGMRILYAIVSTPDSLRQEASTPHDAIRLPPGIYEMRISREYDPFMEQTRQVAD